jgi:hypothetical protein
MNGDERMNLDEHLKHLRLVRRRYGKADRSEKKRLLDEAEVMTGMYRKSLIRRLNGGLERKPRKRRRRLTYGPAVYGALLVMSESADYICSERVQPNLVGMAQHLAAHGFMEVTPELLAQLGRISISSVRRILRRLSQDRPRLPRSRLQAANQASQPVAISRWICSRVAGRPRSGSV